jgi:cation transport ATPase
MELTWIAILASLCMALASNVVGITLAMAGMLNPILAAAAMVLQPLGDR